ncbi:NAD(P)(+) transhydrogenase (Re/Si-specific) subunit beta [bacterium]|nr:NAD(P)(+) transhydrogenase (Re/Si-specific) subunit beta [candidate division CSSED10-310 bacterium]
MEILVNIAYLVAAALFVFGLKGLTKPRTAVRGNLTSAIGMLIAVLVTLLNQHIIGFGVIIAGLVVGGLVGAILAIRIQMTAMPQLVGMFNGFGGGASVLVAGAAMIEVMSAGGEPSMQFTIATVLSGIIGAVTFTGSMVAFAKLQGLMTEKPIRYKQETLAKLGLLALSVILGAIIVLAPAMHPLYWLLAIVAGGLGIALVISIGGADMPVVISLLNSYSGLAAAATGFVLQNNLLIIAGSLVGASGLILTKIMCVAMNRSLANVLFGGMGDIVDTGATGDIYAGKVKSTSPEEVAMMLETCGRVVFVPGYGMAVAQAQHAVRDLTNFLEAHGSEVLFGVHPVAGRMPGHMNVLLAEADIPYEKLQEMDAINPTFSQTDMVIVLGANDVVNPVARTDPQSPIAGMPILDVDKAKTVVVIKRSLSPGFAGIPNPLFILDNTLMLFGDGKKAIQEILAALKEG